VVLEGRGSITGTMEITANALLHSWLDLWTEM